MFERAALTAGPLFEAGELIAACAAADKQRALDFTLCIYVTGRAGNRLRSSISAASRAA